MTSSPYQQLGNDILIVDDAPDNLRLLSELLTLQGYRVRKVMDGELALQAIQRLPPNLILLDIAMPGLDGYQVCQWLKSQPQTQHIPVIFLSAYDDVSNKVQAFQVGGIDYITKPFQTAEVLARVENQLRLYQLQQQVIEQNQLLQAQNLQLQQEMEERQVAQAALQALNQELESRVEHRTLELQERNQQLLDLQAQLQQAFDQERDLSEMKSRLITTISHEFRTPLSVIVYATELLKRSRSAGNYDNDDRYLERIATSTARINQTLENVLFLAQAEANHFRPDPMNVDLFDLCQSVVSNWKLTVDSPHQLVFRPMGSVERLHTDPLLIRRALIALVDNAIRYSPKGGTIVVEVEAIADRLELRVRDPGIGIPAADLPQLFKRFYRASNADQIPGTPGAGLGLAVAGWVVKLLGGTITVTSEVDQGSTFTMAFLRDSLTN